MTGIDHFVDALAEVELPNVFNPYRDVCPEHDKPAGDAIRRDNLRQLLHAAVTQGVRSLWVARDLGYRGGRRTGLALTDELHMVEYGELLGGIELRRATRGPAVAERTAAVIWQMVARVSEPIFMWNVFPFHPHEPGEPMSNRCHTRAERTATYWALQSLIALLCPERVYTIGGDARRGLDEMDIPAIAFRHPSYGGQSQFKREVEAAYCLKSAPKAIAPALKQLPL